MCVAAGATAGLLATTVSIGGSWISLHHLIGPVMPLTVPWVVLAALTGACVLIAALSATLPTALALSHARRHGLMRETVDGS
jgi:putative ABC transport system permease protein